MKKFLNNIKEEAQHIRMSSAEKSAMRAAVFGATSSVQVEKTPYVFLSFWSSHEFRMAMAGLLAFIIVGSGTASAAQGTLPGDFLYPIKLSITEKVEAALAPTTEAKAAVEVALAERRVEEAQALASEGRLSATAATELAASFDEHAAKAEALADHADTEPGTKAQIKARLASSLSTNGAVLQRLGRGSSDEGTKQESDSLGTRVIARAEGPGRVAANARAFAATAPAAKSEAVEVTMMMQATDAAMAEVGEGDQKSAATLQKKAAEALADAKKLFAEVAPGLDAATTAEIEAQFAAADAEMSLGSTLLTDSSAEAQDHFAQILRTSVKLEALLKAEKRFDNGILKSLINENSGEGGQEIHVEN